jgi:hypothetical protein
MPEARSAVGHLQGGLAALFLFVTTAFEGLTGVLFIAEFI